MTTAKKSKEKSKAATPRTKAKVGSARTDARTDPARGEVQGEGDYASAREFNQDEREFVETHDTEALGRGAEPQDSAEAAELDAAERKGKARARPDPEAEEGDDEPEDGAELGRS